jgi:hypothetical protein
MTWRGWQDFPTETAWEMSADDVLRLHVTPAPGGGARGFTLKQAQDLHEVLGEAIEHMESL